ncbi:hypothetical protein RHMOL_Rhmol05G0141300 [Rhododendron molle]|uniref:Uncharacterized protein n=1 Tax=Rhododendron molle TaxID=49168 RepID=A0ACC0NPW3_RHOML|nr:hypothetical protein RHMOL_Rhmol05G0141300 [Rhododendron molle]
MAMGGSVLTGGGYGGAGGSGASSGDVRPNGSLLRDSARGKGTMAEEEETTEVPVDIRPEDVMFRPVEGSSGHRPITKEDVAEFLSDMGLTRLLEEYPEVGITVLMAQEEWEREIAASEATARAEREEPLRDMEAEERAKAKADGPRAPVVNLTRPPFSAEAYVPHMPHLFVPSGFIAYKPRRTKYDVELALRDPETHILSSWTQVCS